MDVPCTPWLTLADVAEITGHTLPAVPGQQALDAATGLLFVGTGRRWPGECAGTVTVTGTGDRDLRTPVGPWRTITAATVDGTTEPVLPSFEQWTVRRAGGVWPCDTEVQLTGTWGADPPSAAITATAILTVELARDLRGEPCRLPRRVTTITAQGITQAVLDDLRVVRDGFTGLPEVDWLLVRFGSQRPVWPFVPGRRPARVTLA